MDENQVKVGAKANLAPHTKFARILPLLLEGCSQEKVARLLEISPSTVSKRCKMYEEKGIIARVSKYPALYMRKKQIFPPIYGVGNRDENQAPIMLPHKFGADFAQVGRPALQYNNRGNAYVYEMSHTVRFGRYTTTIWLHSYVGNSVDEILENGRRSVEALAAMYAQRYNVRLSFRRIIPGIEWCIVSKDISERQAKQEGIERGQQAVVAGAIHKFGDSSHPENMEFNQAPGGTPLKPTEHAETHEYVYSGQLARDMVAMKDAISEEHKLLSEVVGGFVGVRQRLEQIAEKGKI